MAASTPRVSPYPTDGSLRTWPVGISTVVSLACTSLWPWPLAMAMSFMHLTVTSSLWVSMQSYPSHAPCCGCVPWVLPWLYTLRVPCFGWPWPSRLLVVSLLGISFCIPHRGCVPVGLVPAMSLTHLVMALYPWVSPQPRSLGSLPWLCPHKLLCSPVPMSLAAATQL